VGAEHTQELLELPEGGVGTPVELGAAVEVVEVAHHRVVGQRRLVQHADLHDVRA